MRHIEIPPDRTLRRSDLHAAAVSDRGIARLVRSGELIRVRQNTYLRADSEPAVITAMQAGGRLACVSALARYGVFVHGGAEDSASRPRCIHAHVAAHGARFGTPGADVRLHWARLRREPHPADPVVGAVDALIQSAACQSPRAMIASIDSALHLGHLHPDDVDTVFAAFPRRLRRLRGLVDGRAESGTETLVRLMLRGLGIRPELQVWFAGVGRVDLVVDGWLVIECDSRAHHGTWADVRRDRRRDQALAALGYAVYRPIAEDILFDPDSVLRALKGLLVLRRTRRSAGGVAA